MIRIEVNMFSGRPNPVWIITGEAETKRLLGEVAEGTEVIAKSGAGFTGLGFREVKVRLLGDDRPLRSKAPTQFALASTASKDLKASGAIARRLIEAMPISPEIRLVEYDTTPLTRELRDKILDRLERYLADPPFPPPPAPPPPNPRITTINDERCQNCQYEVSQFNPGFWNVPSVQPFNNCYNYGRNWRTDTYAQPGRAHGAATHIHACGTVSTAAMADGLCWRCTCLPASEYPRRLMALVIDPDPLGDYHWYRHLRGGFWGHKPGPGTARNYDNSNVIITNPETCNRGSYTDFCGYFYAGRSVVIN